MISESAMKSGQREKGKGEGLPGLRARDWVPPKAHLPACREDEAVITDEGSLYICWTPAK